MKSEKAPGASQLTTEMVKNLPEDALNFIIDTIQQRHGFHLVACDQTQHTV
jgi:hypothetical protein